MLFLGLCVTNCYPVLLLTVISIKSSKFTVQASFIVCWHILSIIPSLATFFTLLLLAVYIIIILCTLTEWLCFSLRCSARNCESERTWRCRYCPSQCVAGRETAWSLSARWPTCPRCTCRAAPVRWGKRKGASTQGLPGRVKVSKSTKPHAPFPQSCGYTDILLLPKLAHCCKLKKPLSFQQIPPLKTYLYTLYFESKQYKWHFHLEIFKYFFFVIDHPIVRWAKV